MITLIYLASPYSHEHAVVRRSRVDRANVVAAHLMEQGFVVYSPITHGHEIARFLPQDRLLSHKFWMGQGLPMLSVCHKMIIVTSWGWDKSRGVQAEIEHARALGIPIHMHIPHKPLHALPLYEEVINAL